MRQLNLLGEGGQTSPGFFLPIKASSFIVFNGGGVEGRTVEGSSALGFSFGMYPGGERGTKFTVGSPSGDFGSWLPCSNIVDMKGTGGMASAVKPALAMRSASSFSSQDMTAVYQVVIAYEYARYWWKTKGPVAPTFVRIGTTTYTVVPVPQIRYPVPVPVWAVICIYHISCVHVLCMYYVCLQISWIWVHVIRKPVCTGTYV